MCSVHSNPCTAHTHTLTHSHKQALNISSSSFFYFFIWHIATERLRTRNHFVRLCVVCVSLHSFIQKRLFWDHHCLMAFCVCWPVHILHLHRNQFDVVVVVVDVIIVVIIMDVAMDPFFCVLACLFVYLFVCLLFVPDSSFCLNLMWIHYIHWTNALCIQC